MVSGAWAVDLIMFVSSVDSVVVTHVCPCMCMTAVLCGTSALQASASLRFAPGSCWNLGHFALWSFSELAHLHLGLMCELQTCCP